MIYAPCPRFKNTNPFHRRTSLANTTKTDETYSTASPSHLSKESAAFFRQTAALFELEEHHAKPLTLACEALFVSGRGSRDRLPLRSIAQAIQAQIEGCSATSAFPDRPEDRPSRAPRDSRSFIRCIPDRSGSSPSRVRFGRHRALEPKRERCRGVQLPTSWLV